MSQYNNSTAGKVVQFFSLYNLATNFQHAWADWTVLPALKFLSLKGLDMASQAVGNTQFLSVTSGTSTVIQAPTSAFIGPDRELENELTRYLGFMFRNWAARIVHSEIGTVEVECGRVRLKTMREREFLVFTIAPRDTENWNNPDITLAAVTGESETAIMGDRTSLLSLAGVLEPRMARLQ
ncbi:hypothetical protein [Paracidobacterium acidisoli]|uniref:Uncharacterized protein n=1 Tax=Paracidobacterium acidisoli TaxID=2303751 RepID=A0A372IIU9_9BACT|nr:hypothetical protein [Paracidobacterium acidisoli]MBT9333392.1 hypothetical protein [Paracidobacterium acidisoli]